MSKTGRARATTPDQLLGVLLRQSVPVAVMAGTITAIIYALAVGLDAALAAVVGLIATLAFFGVDVVVLHACRRFPPGVLVAALLGEYLVKMLFLGWAVWALSESTDLDVHALAVGVVVSVVALVAAMTRAAITTRSFYFDFGAADSSEVSGNDRPRST